MAFNPKGSRANYLGAGQQISGMIQQGLSSFGAGIAQGISNFSNIVQQQEMKRNKFQQEIFKLIEEIPDEELLGEDKPIVAAKTWTADQISNLERNVVAKWMQYDLDGSKKNYFEKGTLSAKQQALLAAKIKEITSHINEVKTGHESYLKAKEEMLKNKDYWDQEYYENAVAKYMTSGIVPESGFLQQAAIDLNKDIQGFKNSLETRVDKRYINGRDEYTTSYDPNLTEDQKLAKAVNHYNNRYDSNLGYRKAVAERFNNPKYADDKKRQAYYQLAFMNAWQREKNTGEKMPDQNVLTREAIKLYGQLEVAPEYMTPFVSRSDQLSPKQIKDRYGIEDKELIEPENGVWQMYDDPVKLTGYGGARTTNVVELVQGKPKEDMPEGLYFKIFKTTDEAQNIIDKAIEEGNSMALVMSILSPSQYEVDYVPYNDIASMVEKKYKFKGIESFKNGIVKTKAFDFGNTK